MVLARIHAIQSGPGGGGLPFFARVFPEKTMIFRLYSSLAGRLAAAAATTIYFRFRDDHIHPHIPGAQGQAAVYLKIKGQADFTGRAELGLEEEIVVISAAVPEASAPAVKGQSRHENQVYLRIPDPFRLQRFVDFKTARAGLVIVLQEGGGILPQGFGKSGHKKRFIFRPAFFYDGAGLDFRRRGQVTTGVFCPAPFGEGQGQFLRGRAGGFNEDFVQLLPRGADLRSDSLSFVHMRLGRPPVSVFRFFCLLSGGGLMSVVFFIR
jgi:hypothetical protein